MAMLNLVVKHVNEFEAIDQEINEQFDLLKEQLKHENKLIY